MLEQSLVKLRKIVERNGWEQVVGDVIVDIEGCDENTLQQAALHMACPVAHVSRTVVRMLGNPAKPVEKHVEVKCRNRPKEQEWLPETEECHGRKNRAPED